MVKLNSGYRKVYDELSEVVHPNGTGIMFFYTQFVSEGVATFDDGQHQSEATLGHLITATYMLICAEPANRRLELKLDQFLSRQSI